jgi:hypothetical protein
MTTNLSYGDDQHDEEWGTVFAEVRKETIDNIFVCHVQVSDLEKIANKLSKEVLNNSWIMDLDPGSRPTYQQTVAETAEILVNKIKDQLSAGDKVSSEFGEIMVSMGASRALEIIFNHVSIPLAELWKPKASGNEGFDFHTVCPNKLINFGEAKFSSSSNPYGGNTGESSGAGGQADGFVKDDKHHRDRPLLVDLEVGEDAIKNLKNQLFGVVLAFSMNTPNPLEILKNAIQKALSYQNLSKAKSIYIVGVSHAT